MNWIVVGLLLVVLFVFLVYPVFVLAGTISQHEEDEYGIRRS